MATLREVGEFPLIRRLLARVERVRAPSASVRVGPGDDAAVSLTPAPGCALVSTTDILVEGVDFTAAFPARSVGRKAIAVNLSDVYAMGGRPRGVLVAVAAPAATEVAWLEAAYDGIAEILAEREVDLLGGDVSSSGTGGITLAVTAFGEVEEDRAVRRAGARAGDVLCVTGTLGDASAGLERLLAGGAPDLADPLVRRQLEPSPPPVGPALARAGLAHAMIDVSDGLLADLGHLLDAAGGLGARIETAKLPLSPALGAHGHEALRHALVGGEDFELLFALAPADVAAAREICRAHGTTMAEVGFVTARPGTLLVRADGTELPPPPRGGWDHFPLL